VLLEVKSALEDRLAEWLGLEPPTEPAALVAAASARSDLEAGWLNELKELLVLLRSVESSVISAHPLRMSRRTTLEICDRVNKLLSKLAPT
jgi:hypothetical protein